jgi:hypothetical protein
VQWQINFWRRTRLIAEACLKREGLAFLAFLLSAGAGPVLCAMLFYMITVLEEAKQFEAVANLAYGLLLTIALLMWSVHRLLGSKQAIEVEFLKLKAKLSQGD